MSLNHIHLPAIAIADLYKSVLIASNDAPVIERETVSTEILSTEKSSKQSINFLGSNKKQIVIIVNYKDDLYIPDDSLAFLTSILTACKLNLADIALVNFKTAGIISYKDFFKAIPATSVLLFNVTPDIISVPMNFPFFQVQHFDGINYLSSPSLDEIEKDKLLKGNLWTSLKKIFNL